MSTAEKVAENAANACVGAVAMALGDASGGAALMVQSLGGFAVLALGRQSDPARVAQKRATDAALDALRANPEFASANLARMAFLLSKADFEGISHRDLLAAIRETEGPTIAPPLVRFLFARLPLDQDDEPTLALTRIVLEAAMGACTADPAFRDNLRDLMLMTLVREKMERKITADRPGLAEAHDELIFALAERYIPEPTTDFMAAYRGIKAALAEYDRMRAQKALPSNIGDQIDALMARLDALNTAGQFEKGAEALAHAAAEARERRDRETAGLMRILDLSVSQARLGNRPREAAAALVEKLRLDTPPDLFEALRALWNDWDNRGNYGGLNFEAEVAIHLAHATRAKATTPDQRGTALNALGMALNTLGQRESGTARLEEAVTAYRAALEEWTRDRVPLDWAGVQMNLGNTLLALGEREPGTARLEDAVTADRAALEEWTRDLVPLDWATAQMNLGIALQAVGKRKPDGARLNEGVTAIRAALEIRTRDRAPRDWALTQLNLGNALMDLGARERGTARIQDAVAAFGEALEVFTQDRAPLEWATAHYNLGMAFAGLGQLENSTTRLEDAITAYRAALQERSRDRVPLQWAATVAAQGRATYLLAERTQDAALASEGLHLLQQGLDGLREGGHAVRAETYARTIAFADELFARLCGGTNEG